MAWPSGLAYAVLVVGLCLLAAAGPMRNVRAAPAVLSLTITSPVSGALEFGEVSSDEPLTVTDAVTYRVSVNPGPEDLEWHVYGWVDAVIPGCTLETRPSGAGSGDWMVLTAEPALLGTYAGSRDLSDDFRLTVEWWAEAGPYSYTITYDVVFADTVPPHGCSVTISGGTGYTSSPAVTLSLSAQDNSGHVEAMCFSNDGETWSEWVDYAPAAAWTLSPEDGEKTVWAKFRDPVGNVSDPVWDTIILDRVSPVIFNLDVVDIAPTHARVTWETDEPADSRASYVERETSPWLTTETEPGPVITHSVALEGLSPGTEYLYRAHSSDPAGNPAETPEGPSFWTPCEAPSITTGMERIGTSPDYQVSVLWSSSLNAVDYIVYREDLSTGTVAEWSLGPEATSFEETVTGPADYRYWVAAVNGQGAPSSSAPEDVHVPADTEPPILEVTSFSYDQRDAVISWTTWFDQAMTITDPATSQVFYRVYHETSPGPWSSTPLDPALVTAHTVTVTGLAPYTEYELYAESRDAAANPGTSAILRFTTVSDPRPPENFRAEKLFAPNYQMADLAWNAVTGAVRYDIYQRDVMDAGNPGPWTFVESTTSTTYRWRMQIPGQVPAYKYELYALAVNASGSESSPSNIIVLQKPPP